MFKGREVRVGDTLWRSRAYGLGKSTEKTLALEYKVSELLVGSSFMARPQGETPWRETSIDHNRRWDRESYYWDKEDAKEDSRRCAIISDIDDVTDRIRRALEDETLWLLPAEKMRPAYDAMAALLLAVADAEQEKEQADA
jgi:hypothetical protein